jgi:hypothetical protein
VHHVLAGKTGFPSGEARRDLRHQVIEQALVIVMEGYSGRPVEMQADYR